MSFRRHGNRHDYWLEMCDRHADLLSCIPASVAQNENRFRALLTMGELSDERGATLIRLRDLSDAEIDGLWTFIDKAQFDMDALSFDGFNDEFRRRRSR